MIIKTQRSIKVQVDLKVTLRGTSGVLSHHISIFLLMNISVYISLVKLSFYFVRSFLLLWD